MNYYNEIKEKLIKSEIYDRAKDYSKDRHKVSVYYEIGKLLSKAGKAYGKNIIKQYSCFEYNIDIIKYEYHVKFTF